MKEMLCENRVTAGLVSTTCLGRGLRGNEAREVLNLTRRRRRVKVLVPGVDAGC